MSCICVLYKSDTKDSPNPNEHISSDFQVNYWKLPKKYWGYERFIDLGLLLYDAKDISSVLFYVPFKVKMEQLSDLGLTLVNDNLLSVLFNETLKIEDDSKIRGYRFASSNNPNGANLSFWLACLANTDFEIHELSKGSLIEVKIKTKPPIKKGIKRDKDKQEDNFNLYIRFRISNLKTDDLSSIESVSNDFLQNAFSRTEMMNLHINTLGEIDEEDYKDIVSNYSFVTFNKIHFFFIGSSEEESISGSTKYTDSRLLESKKWKPYIGDKNPKDKKCLAYHWKISGPVEHGNIFLRTVYSSANILKIIKYSIGVIILGALGSFFASLIS